MKEVWCSNLGDSNQLVSWCRVYSSKRDFSCGATSKLFKDKSRCKMWHLQVQNLLQSRPKYNHLWAHGGEPWSEIHGLCFWRKFPFRIPNFNLQDCISLHHQGLYAERRPGTVLLCHSWHCSEESICNHRDLSSGFLIGKFHSCTRVGMDDKQL